jgi:formylmethanofuran dehydrogenase subunit B
MSDPIRIVNDATCTFCGCVCDDIVLTVDTEQHRITKSQNACVLGKAWFKEHGIEARPHALIGGREASTEEAVEEAAQILANARFPVIYGLSDTTCEAQRVAVSIADMIGGNVDTTTSVCHGPTGIAFQGVGESTATLGEVRNRADLVIFWGGNPAEAHPRLFARYAVTPKGMFVPNGRKDRTVVLVDVRRTQSTPVADIFVQVKPGADFELLWALRALVKGRRVDAAAVERRTGVAMTVLEDLVVRMKSCRFGVLFFGMGLTMTRGRHFNAGALLSLATDLNEFTHFVAAPVRGHGNVTGADNVMSWQTGFPFGVNLSRGYPRFNPGEFTTVDLLSRGEADAAMFVATDPASNFPKPAIEHMRRIPVISLDPKPTPTGELSRVVFTTATYGINVAGTAYRMDNVPLPLRPAFDSPYPSDQEVLTAIRRRVGELLGGNRLPVGAAPAGIVT